VGPRTKKGHLMSIKTLSRRQFGMEKTFGDDIWDDDI
jgi:hypothetical protein